MAAVGVRGTRLTFALVVMTIGALLLWPAASALGAPAASPAVRSLSTSAAPVGSQITIYGSGFGTATSTSFVTFQGVHAIATRWTDTEVDAIVPDRTVPGYVGVSVGNVTSNGLWFSPSVRPTVTVITPNCAPPGTPVTLLGTGFGATQRTSKVIFGGVAASVSYWSNTRIVATAPQLAKSAYAGVWVNGIASNGVLFNPFMPATITSVSHQAALAGDLVTVSGFRFGSTQTSKSKLTLGGVEVPVDSWSDRAITFRVPADGPNGYIGVYGPDGVCSNGKHLWTGAKISGLSRTSASPGDVVAVHGAGFGDTQSTTQLRLGSQVLTADEWSSTCVTFTVPADAPDASYVVIVRGGVQSNGKWLRAKASLSGVNDQFAIVGESVTLTGVGFGATQSPTTELRLGGRVLTPDSWSDTAVTFTIPMDAYGGYLGVYRDGFASNGIMLYVGGRTDSLSAWHATPGDDLTITGVGFGSAEDTVTFSDVKATVRSWSDTQIVVTVPDAPEGYIRVRKGSGSSDGKWFLPLYPPGISGPTNHNIAQGELVTITGSHFGSSQGSKDSVKLGSTELTVTAWSDTSITAQIPADATANSVNYASVTKSGVVSNGWWLRVWPSP